MTFPESSSTNSARRFSSNNSDARSLASAAVALLAGLGGGLIYDKIVTILITAFEGAVLLVSGVSAIVMDWPWLYSYLHSMVLGSAFVLPFCLLVPTIVASFYQMADVRRSQAPH